MSFLDIENPRERDRIVADFLATRRNIQQRNEDERVVGLAKSEELATMFKPIVEAQRETTKSVEELKKPAAAEPAPPPPTRTILKRKRTWNARESPLNYYYETFPEKAREKYYGIVKGDDGGFIMGNKKVRA